MAITQREHQIIDAYDAGQSPAQIASLLGLRRSYVEKRCRDLGAGAAVGDKSRSGMQRRSDRLRDAILHARMQA